MMSNLKYNQRGFEQLVGETIKRIDTSCINVVHIHCESGKIISIDAEEQHYGIPAIRVGEGWETK